MKKTLSAVAGIILVACLFLLVSFHSKVNAPITKTLSGSGVDGGAYFGTTTDQTMLTATQFQVLKNGAGKLGNVVITLSTTAAFNLYDATTTTSHANHATTTLAKFGASAAAGTYNFEVAFSRGLIIEFPAGQVTVASTTITWQ